MTGMKESIGPFGIPTRPASQPHWKIATTTPSDAPMLSRFINAACTGITTRAEHDEQQQGREQHHDADEQRQLARRSACEVTSICAPLAPPTGTVAPVARSTAAAGCRAGCDQVRGRLVLRRRARVDGVDEPFARRATTRGGATAADAGRRAQRGADLGRAARHRPGGSWAATMQRPVEALAEALGQQVVGAAVWSARSGRCRRRSSPGCIESTGTVSSSMIARPTIAPATGGA